MQPLVLLLGVPGAGKTSLGQELAPALSATLLSLDAIKEARFAAGLDRDDRFAMRLACEAELVSRAGAEPGPVVVDVWVEPGRDDDRITRWLDAQSRPVVQVICRVPADVAVARYLARPRSGPHLAADAATLERIRAAVEAIGPLGDWPTVEVDTTTSVALAPLRQTLRAALRSVRAPATPQPLPPGGRARDEGSQDQWSGSPRCGADGAGGASGAFDQ